MPLKMQDVPALTAPHFSPQLCIPLSTLGQNLLAAARAYISAPKHVMHENAVLKSDEYETLALHMLVIT
jgi:hypothetical protein